MSSVKMRQEGQNDPAQTDDAWSHFSSSAVYEVRGDTVERRKEFLQPDGAFAPSETV